MPRPSFGPIGPDIDLDEEEVYSPNGERLTEQAAQEIAERAIAAARRGRPSISGEKAKTPNLTVRVPPPLRRALESIAAAQGRRLADVGRDALAEYAKRHSAAGRTAGRAVGTTAKAVPAKGSAKAAPVKKAPVKKAAVKAAPRRTAS